LSSLADKLLGFPPWLALALIFALPAAEASMFVGLFFPGELIILLGGVLANQHKLPLWAVLVVGSVGAIIGDSIGYEVGRRFGDRVLARLPKRLVKPEHLDRGRDLLRRKGGRAVFIGRFTAALRALVPGLAGTSRLPYPTFLLFNVLGAVAWVSVTAVTGYAVGSSYHHAEKRLSLISFGILSLVVVWLLSRALRRSERLRTWSRRRFGWLDRLDRILVATLAVFAGAVWLVAGLTQDVVAREGVVVFDPRLLGDVIARRSAVLTPLAKITTFLGTGPVVYGLLILTGVLLWRRTRNWQPLVLAVSWLAAGQLVRLALNRSVGRPRPPAALHLVLAHGFAFPSGHTTTATIGYGLLAVLAAMLLSWGRRWFPAVAVVLAVLVGLSRVYLGVHWPTDVLGGWALGVGWLALGAAVSRIIALRRHRAGPDRGGLERPGVVERPGVLERPGVERPPGTGPRSVRRPAPRTPAPAPGPQGDS
jgi:undecaprenyl-diphosphatase